METINVKGKVLGTTNKTDYDSKGKTAYLVLSSPEEFKKANDFGLTVYTSKENGDDFIIVKTPENLSIFDNSNNTKYDLPSASNLDIKNYYTNAEVYISIGKGKSNEYNKEFYRLLALGVDSIDSIKFVSPLNPFTNKETVNGGKIIG